MVSGRGFPIRSSGIEQAGGRRPAPHRSADESERWFLEQLGGQFLGAQCSTFVVLKSAGDLSWCGLQTSFIGQRSIMQSEVVMRDDDTAHLMGKLSLALARVRCRWGLFFLRSWPCGFVGVLQGESSRTVVLQQLRSTLPISRR